MTPSKPLSSTHRPHSSRYLAKAKQALASLLSLHGLVLMNACAEVIFATKALNFALLLSTRSEGQSWSFCSGFFLFSVAKKNAQKGIEELKEDEYSITFVTLPKIYFRRRRRRRKKMSGRMIENSWPQRVGKTQRAAFVCFFSVLWTPLAGNSMRFHHFSVASANKMHAGRECG